jgi:hypothetical protein
MRTRQPLASGNVIPVIFWGTRVVCGYVKGGYDHLARLVSELGATGTRSLWFIGRSRAFSLVQKKRSN